MDIGVNPNLVGLRGPGRVPINVDFVTVDQTPPSRSSILVTVNLTRPPSPVVRAVVNAASLEPAVSPGALVSVLGSSLAPTLSASFDSGGPAGRINAVAPYQLAGQELAQVVVRYYPGTVAERTSAAFSVPVTDTSLAIFTSARTGSGQPGILSCDGEGCTANQPQNPAPPGSIVPMFGTAAGIWTNNVPDGSVSVRARSFDYSRVSLTIGGQPARVLYAGTAPFQVWGEFQVNAIMPTGLPSGPQPGGTTQQRPGVGDFVCQAVLFWAARPGEPFAVTRYRKDYRLRYQHLSPSPIPHLPSPIIARRALTAQPIEMVVFEAYHLADL